MIIIREALPGDSLKIAGFQVEMARETENLDLDAAVVRKGVDAVFADKSKGSYYIAESGGFVIASLLTTYEWSDWRNGMIVWLQSVYVLPEFRKKGIFNELFMYIKQMVEADPTYFGIRLYVDNTNEQAIQVYRKCGMDGDHYRLFEWMSPG